MAQIIISALPTGTPKGTDLTPATDTTDTSSAPTGTTKKYVRSSELAYYLGAQGYIVIGAVRLASTTAYTATYANGASGVGATLTNAGAVVPLVVDGVAPVLGDAILITDQTPAYQNGIYTLTTVGTTLVNWVLTRATNYNMASQIAQYDYIVVDQGATLAGVGFQETGPGPFTIGATSLIFTPVTPFNGAYLPLSLANGGTGAALTASNGGIFYSNATTGAILAGTGTASRVLLSGASTAPAWSTATYPATTTINQLLYSSSASVITGLATLNNGVLVTGATGIPALLANSGTAGFVLTANTGAPPSWQAISADGAITTIDGDAGSVAPSAGVVTVSGGTTGLTTSGTSATLSLTGTLKLANGGTNASLTASNGGIFYSTASAGAILAGTATAGQLLTSGSSTTPAWTTSTYPATNAVSTLLYASSANVMAALATANDGVLITSNTGVPSWLANSGTAGFVLTANSGAPPSWQAGGSSGFTWAANSNASISAAVNNGYVLTSGSATTVTLPTTFAVGTQIGVAGQGAAWTVAVGAATNIKAFGNTYTTSFASANNTDTLILVATVANTTWAILSMSTTGFTAS